MKVKVIIGSTIILGAIFLFFLMGGGKSAKVFYQTPTDFLKSNFNNGERVRLTGKVEKGSISIAENKLDLNFNLIDENEKVKVHYKGTIPEAFAEDLEVVADGRHSNGIFEAKEIIVKCPSKYESKLDNKEDKK
jgi:cytochrome c-type biogenesis protein CcmE